jgi:hypothetical protein
MILNHLGRFVTPPGWLLAGKGWLLSGTGHADSVTEERREEFLNLISPAIYLVTSHKHGAQDRVAKSGFDFGMSEDDQIWAKPELTVMTRARAVSRRRGVRPRVRAGVDAGTSAARAVTYPRPAEDKKLDEVGRALKLVGLNHLVEHVEEEAPWDQMLSGGEKEACIRADPASSAERHPASRDHRMELLTKEPCLSGLYTHPPVLVFFHNRTSTRSPLAPMSWTRWSERAMRE